MMASRKDPRLPKHASMTSSKNPRYLFLNQKFKTIQIYYWVSRKLYQIYSLEMQNYRKFKHKCSLLQLLLSLNP